MDYNYDFDIIELALKKTTSKTNPNFDYLDSIITDWHNNNFKTKEEIMSYEAARKKKIPGQVPYPHQSLCPQKGNFEQRKYEDEYLNSLYEMHKPYM